MNNIATNLKDFKCEMFRHSNRVKQEDQGDRQELILSNDYHREDFSVCIQGKK